MALLTLGLSFASSAVASPVPQRNAEPLQYAPHEGDGFHATPAGSPGTFAFVREWRIAESAPETTRIPAPLRRVEASSSAWFQRAAVPLPAVFVGLGTLGWVLRTARRSS